MNKKYLTSKELKYIKKTLKDIKITKKLDDIISKEVILKKQDISEDLRDLLISDVNMKTVNLSNDELVNNEFKNKLLLIMNLNDYNKINNNNYFNIDNKKIFVLNFDRFKLFIKNNYIKIKIEDFMSIYKLFLKTYILNKNKDKAEVNIPEENIPEENKSELNKSQLNKSINEDRQEKIYILNKPNKDDLSTIYNDESTNFETETFEDKKLIKKSQPVYIDYNPKNIFNDFINSLQDEPEKSVFFNNLQLYKSYLLFREAISAKDKINKKHIPDKITVVANLFTEIFENPYKKTYKGDDIEVVGTAVKSFLRKKYLINIKEQNYLSRLKYIIKRFIYG